MKYIVVTGGCMSGIGKGIVTSSIGAVLKACNLKVTAIKIDPYINIDAGTFSPIEHGEVFVLNDGCEVDLDLGNYERFLDVDLNSANNITTGKIYQLVINRERKGDFLGKTTQVVPHITSTMQEWIVNTAAQKVLQDTAPYRWIDNSDKKEDFDVCVIELGGTVGDIESSPFIEALRQLRQEVDRDNFFCCHVTHVPIIGKSKEQKTKPTQMSVKTLFGLGLQPDVIVCRCEVPIHESVRNKISNFCNVKRDCVFSLPDLESVYRVPIELQEQGIIRAISKCLKIEGCQEQPLQGWTRISDIAEKAKDVITIALVGKYTDLRDAYISVTKSLEYGCYSFNARPDIRFIDSELLENGDDNRAWKDLRTSDCLIVPGGFGTRGMDGKMKAINWARVNKVPFLGICLGFQLAVIEFARNVMSIKNAHSDEYREEMKKQGEDVDITPIVIMMLEYLDEDRKMGGTMRLGLRKTKFVVENSILRNLYGDHEEIWERHRHRYEINPEHIDSIQKAGLRFVGKNDDGSRMEILELDRETHPYFVAVQYHPEYLSRPFKPSPPYYGLIQAARVGMMIQKFDNEM